MHLQLALLGCNLKREEPGKSNHDVHSQRQHARTPYFTHVLQFEPNCALEPWRLSCRVLDLLELKLCDSEHGLIELE